MITYYLIFLGVMSLVTFILYAVDKQKAKSGSWRISEKALLLTSFFGGAIGGLSAMLIFRHKTKHWYFYAVNVVGVLLHVGIAVYLATSGI